MMTPLKISVAVGRRYSFGCEREAAGTGRMAGIAEDVEQIEAGVGEHCLDLWSRKGRCPAEGPIGHHRIPARQADGKRQSPLRQKAQNGVQSRTLVTGLQVNKRQAAAPQ